jgi:hypothetical protein
MFNQAIKNSRAHKNETKKIKNNFYFRKKHKKYCRYNLKRLPARMDMAHAALA